jgi:(p)ppGpp synthase/HD superfamily hydrolase
MAKKLKKGEMLESMIRLMVNAHAGQYDRGGQPYCLHPLKVMHYLKSMDEELQCAALGHDVLEDTDTTEDDLREAGMSERVITTILAVTKRDGESYDEYKQRVFASTDAMKVKKADLRHNSDIRRLKGVTEKDIARAAKYHTFYLEIEARQRELGEI